MKKQELIVNLINSDIYEIDEINVYVEKDLTIIDQQEVDINTKYCTFELENDEYKVYAIFISKGLSYITPKLPIKIPDDNEIDIDLSEAEVDDVCVDPF